MYMLIKFIMKNLKVSSHSKLVIILVVERVNAEAETVSSSG